jgi:hypothetical protein
MEHFFLEDRFYHELGDLIDDLFPEDGDVEGLEDDWSIRVQESKSEKCCQLSLNRIVDNIMEDVFDLFDDRMPINNEYEINEIRNAIISGIDLDKINESLPSYHYPTTFTTITKQDLLDHLND